MPLQPRKAVSVLKTGIHGGFDYAELERLGVSPGEIIDFSVSTSPLGIPPGVLSRLGRREISEYPDSRSIELRRSIARRTGVDEKCVLAGAGSTELIRLAVLACLDGTDKALIIGPTYGEYRTACEIAGAEVLTCDAHPHNDFQPNIEAVITSIHLEKPKIVFICNPNNPTGFYLGADDFEKILAAAGDSLLVLDEAYISFVGGSWDSTGYLDRGNLLVLRSMTKDYALAGLRLGYALAQEDIIEVLQRVCPPWNVNAAASRAGIAALEMDDYPGKSRALAAEGKRYLVRGIGKLGFRCVPSAANFFLVEVGNASGLRSRLLEKKILVRDCASFGLPGYMRIAPRKQKENRRLIAALRELKNE